MDRSTWFFFVAMKWRRIFCSSSVARPIAAEMVAALSSWSSPRHPARLIFPFTHGPGALGRWCGYYDPNASRNFPLLNSSAVVFAHQTKEEKRRKSATVVTSRWRSIRLGPPIRRDIPKRRCSLDVSKYFPLNINNKYVFLFFSRPGPLNSFHCRRNVFFFLAMIRAWEKNLSSNLCGTSRTLSRDPMTYDATERDGQVQSAALYTNW